MSGKDLFENLKEMKNFKPSIESEPSIWVKEVKFLRKLAPGEENLIRHISLHPGVNVLWADANSENGEADAGHSAGKTTFCRILRYILGEKRFGNEQTQRSIKDNFNEAYVVAEVRVSKQSWLICLPLGWKQTKVAAKGCTLKDLLSENLPDSSWQDYLDALEAVSTESLNASTLPNGTVLNWSHLIQWLTRDQEARYNSLHVWRAPSSDSDSPELPAASDRYYVVRSLLGFISDTEQKLLVKDQKLSARKTYLEREIPKREYHSQIDRERLEEDFPEQIPPFEDELFIKTVNSTLDKHQERLEKEISDLQENASIDSYSDKLEIASKFAAELKARLQNESKDLELHENALKKLNKERAATEDDMMTLCESQPTKTFTLCQTPIFIAYANKCPCLPDQVKKDDIDPLHSFEEDIKLYRRKVEAQGEAVSKLNKQCENAEKAIISLKAEANNSQSALSRQVNPKRNELLEVFHLRSHAKNAHNSWSQLQGYVTELLDINKELSTTQSLLQKHREDGRSDLSTLRATLESIAWKILGKEYSIDLKVTPKKIKINLNKRGDRSSVAMETLKVLLFDIASLVYGVEGHCRHPRFLVHDSPREADISLGIYHKLFLSMIELHKSFGEREPNFQYIITTTEAPPEEAKDKKYLIEMLDASHEDGRLLKKDL